MTIEDLLSFGLVEVGICRDDLLSMSVDEFVAMQKTYIEKRRSEAYDRWDRLAQNHTPATSSTPGRQTKKAT